MVLGDNRDVRAIMLDMGGVIVDLDMPKCIDAFYTRAGFMTIREFIDTCHPQGFFARYETGLISTDELYAECISRSRPNTTPGIIKECIESLLVGIDTEKAKLLKRLSERCDMYMLSNNNPIALDFCSQLFADADIPLEKIFRHLFCSYQLHVCKPSPEFFRMVFDRIDIKPSQAVFVDDSPKNVKAAEDFGIDARLYVQGTDLAQVLRPVW